MRIVGILIVIGLLYYTFFVLLPSEVDWSEVWADLQALSAGEIAALFVAGLLVILVLGWTSKASLPGLTLYEGTESSVTTQLSAFVFPPPSDMVIRFAMYRTYGFSDEQSAAAVIIAMVARYATVLFMPLLGITLVLITGGGSWNWLFWLVLLGAVYAAGMWLILRIARSDSAAHKAGGWLQRLSERLFGLVHRTAPDTIAQNVVRFGAHTRSTIAGNGRVLVAANLAWGMSNVLVMGLVLRFSGLNSSDVPPAAIALTTGLLMAVNMLPIPGKDALVVGWIAAMLALTDSSEVSALGTALLLYRMVTWIVPMPIGGIAFLAWRIRVGKDAARPVGPGAQPVA
ncbi:MAG: lysylphosphatidylglycerol synthase domain-containing protein [Candidatus Nanopelagicales bacterium]